MSDNFFVVLFLAWVLQSFLIFVYTLRFSSHKQRVMTADKIRFPLLLVSCFISLFRPKDLTFPTFPIFLDVFDRKLLFKNLPKISMARRRGGLEGFERTPLGGQ